MRLRELGARGVVTVDAAAEPWEAAQKMGEQAVGCLVVVAAGGVAVGVLTDRDLVLRVVAAGGMRPGACVGDLMTSPVRGLAPDDGLEDAVALMRSAGVRRVPLLEQGVPVGLVSLGDVLEALARGLLDLGEEALSARESALRAARDQGPLGEIQELARAAHERLGHAKYRVQEALAEELDTIRERLRRALEGA